MEDFNGTEIYAVYSTFYVGNETTKYKLTVSWNSGNAGRCTKYKLIVNGYSGTLVSVPSTNLL